MVSMPLSQEATGQTKKNGATNRLAYQLLKVLFSLNHHQMALSKCTPIHQLDYDIVLVLPEESVTI